MKLHRNIGVTQATALFMLQRIREAWIQEKFAFVGPLEVDETYMGWSKRNWNNRRRKDKDNDDWPSSKTPVIGAKDRASNQVSTRVVASADKRNLQTFVKERAIAGATAYTDAAPDYRGLPYQHEAVNHSVKEYVRGQAHTNGIESFWAMLKRAHKGTFHKLSPKHLHRYVNEFAGKHNVREMDTIEQMKEVTRRMAGRRLNCHQLVAPNGLSNAAHS